MAKLKHWLSASSIIESITATIIFMTVFSLSMGIVVNISTINVCKYDFIAIDKYYREVIKDYLSDHYPYGEYTHNSDIATAKISIGRYVKSSSAYKIDIKIYSHSGKEIIEQTHLISF